MKFRLNPAWPELDDLLRQCGLSPVPFSLPSATTRWEPIEAEVGLDEVPVPPEGEPYRDVRGAAVFIYIRDVRLKANHVDAAAAAVHPEDYTRIHLTECQTISEMRGQGRFERYVKTNSRAGPLRVNLTTRGGDIVAGAIDLRVCRNCLNAMDWRGYRNKAVGEKKRIWMAFDRSEFLAAYTPSFTAPPRGDEDDPPDTYTPDWQAISRQARERADYICERCHVHVGRAEGSLLDVHHRDHKKSNNIRSNLEVVCKLCHAAIHSHYKPTARELDRLMTLRREQGISR